MTDPTPEQLRNLADRAEHGLTPDETARLRSGLIVLGQRLKAARDLCSSLGAQLTQAEAAIERVRAELANPLLHTRDPERQGERWLAARILAALDEHQEQPPAAPPAHIGNRANAEDCPACSGTNPPYPFICPGPKDA
ncbi:hypothetical protein [Streptomyces sp. NPDC056543]|uniref:hypothetical protein n=1 Tax=unclassified Streptomyces TaxID=2593676 RepID=UPI00367BD49E